MRLVGSGVSPVQLLRQKPSFKLLVLDQAVLKHPATLAARVNVVHALHNRRYIVPKIFPQLWVKRLEFRTVELPALVCCRGLDSAL